MRSAPFELLAKQPSSPLMIDSGFEYDDYADVERPAVLSEKRKTAFRVLRASSCVLAAAGVLFLVGSVAAWALSGLHYSIASTYYFGGVIGGAAILVAAANAWFWYRWLRRTSRGWVAAALALVVLSPPAVVVLAMAVLAATSL